MLIIEPHEVQRPILLSAIALTIFREQRRRRAQAAGIRAKFRMLRLEGWGRCACGAWKIAPPYASHIDVLSPGIEGTPSKPDRHGGSLAVQSIAANAGQSAFETELLRPGHDRKQGIIRRLPLSSSVYACLS